MSWLDAALGLRSRRFAGNAAEIRRGLDPSRYSFWTNYDGSETHVSTNDNSETIRLLLVPLEDIVVFPNMNVTLTVDVGDEDRVLLIPKHEDSYANVGTVAEVTDRIRLPGGGRAIALNG